MLSMIVKRNKDLLKEDTHTREFKSTKMLDYFYLIITEVFLPIDKLDSSTSISDMGNGVLSLNIPI